MNTYLVKYSTSYAGTHSHESTALEDAETARRAVEQVIERIYGLTKYNPKEKPQSSMGFHLIDVRFIEVVKP